MFASTGGVVVETGGRHVEYDVSVTKGAHTWSVSRRYNDFAALDSKLKAKLSSYRATLPSRGMGRKFDKAHIDSRVGALNKFLEQMFSSVSQDKLFAEPHVKWFFSYDVPLGAQSTILPGNEGETGLYRNPFNPELLTHEYDEVRTLYDAFRRGVTVHPDNTCLGTRVDGGDYQWQTYKQVEERIAAAGAGLLTVGIGKDDFVGFCSVNCPEYLIGQHGCYHQSMVPVPIYPTLGVDAVSFIIGETEMSVILVQSKVLKTVLSAAKTLSCVKTIVVMDNVYPDEANDWAEAANCKLMTFMDLEAAGKEAPKDPVPPTPDTTSLVCYTSGTTGNPKGALLTHGNFIAMAAGGSAGAFLINQSDVHLSYMPFAHVAEQAVMPMYLMKGASIGFWQGDIMKLMDDVAKLRPTIFVGVPRIYNRIYDQVLVKVGKSAVAKMLFDWGMSSKKSSLYGKGFDPATLEPSTVWDKVVFKKIRDVLGGRIRLMVSGAAPLSAEVKDFLQCCFGCRLYEAYGQTECTGIAMKTLTEDPIGGVVGPPMSSIEVKLVDIPEMNYRASDSPNPRGEVCFRGPSVFKGYYKQEEKTKEALDADGWLHSGDVGMWMPNGTLKIIDRKKAIFKLAQGEYCAPEKLENVYQMSPLVAQIFVYGDSFQRHLVAIVVPDPGHAATWAKSNGMDEKTLEDLCKEDKFKQAVLDDLKKVGKERKLVGFEFIKRVHLDHNMFTPDNNILTGTMKLKRPAARDHYQKQIDEMYASITD